MKDMVHTKITGELKTRRNQSSATPSTRTVTDFGKKNTPERRMGLKGRVVTGEQRLFVRHETSKGKSNYLVEPAIHNENEIIIGPPIIISEPERKGLGTELLKNLHKLFQELAKRTGKKVVHQSFVATTNFGSQKLFSKPELGYEITQLPKSEDCPAKLLVRKEFLPNQSTQKGTESARELTLEEKRIVNWFIKNQKEEVPIGYC